MSAPSCEEQRVFLGTIESLFPKSAVLDVTTFKIGPSSNVGTVRRLPPTVMSLASVSLSSTENGERLLEHLTFNKDQAEYLAEATKDQSNSLLWFDYRKGRITASVFGSVNKTSLEKPSKSVIERILQPKPIPNVPALQWGRTNEDVARREYMSKISANHTCFDVRRTGLHLHQSYPYLGVSPDGIVSCTCCGTGLLESKCPYSRRDIEPNCVDDPQFYLKRTDLGLSLSIEHDYYLQVQGQLFLCDYQCCDFVRWTPKGIYLERILRDSSVFLAIEPKLRQFFLQCIIPHIRENSAISQGASDGGNDEHVEEVYCFVLEVNLD